MPPSRRIRDWAFGAIALVIAAACAVFDVAIVTEYYGDGPPYYGRTENMDKWSSPVVPMVFVNGVGIVSMGTILLLLRRRRQRRR